MNTKKFILLLVTLSCPLLISCTDIREESEYLFIHEGEGCKDYYAYKIDNTNACYLESSKRKAFCFKPKTSGAALDVVGCFINQKRDLLVFLPDTEHTSDISSFGFESCHFEATRGSINESDKCRN